jgi:Protein of unknown function (DUF3570)
MSKNHRVHCSKRNQRSKQALLAAALSLPGLGITTAEAGNAPEEGVIGFKILHYHDYQPSANRMTVVAPSIYVSKTVPGDVVVQGSYVYDAVSGASPRSHSTISGASRIKDIRRAGDLKLTKYWERMAFGVSLGRSKEDDYRSNAVGADLRIFSEDKNTTYAFGLGGAADRIRSVEDADKAGSKSTREMLLGITQVLTRNDIVQTNVTYSRGRGYFDDPYKSPDYRPDHRNQFAWLVRWNHHFDGLDASMRNTFRYYQDTYGVKGVMLGTEWEQPMSSGWTLTPSLRYYSQSAASFYYDPGLPPANATYLSADQRLSSFGAITPGLKIAKSLAGGWVIDFKAEYYEQRGDWKLSGKGSTGLEPFKAQFYQFGIAKKF